MQRTLTGLIGAALVFAAPLEAGSTKQGVVAEIVTYKLKPGADETAYLEAARGTIAFLTETGAVISRSMSKDADGLWTDYILWTSMEAAKAAEAEAMQRPEFGAFFSMADESTMTMRHAPVYMTMD